MDQQVVYFDGTNLQVLGQQDVQTAAKLHCKPLLLPYPFLVPQPLFSMQPISVP